MNAIDTRTRDKLETRVHEAYRALLACAETPCRGQIYPYTRGGRQYFKWEHREDGRRVQHTVGLAEMEALQAGINARAAFEERINAYYAACEELARARAHMAADAVAGADSKKNGLVRQRRRKSGAARAHRPPRP